MEKKCKLIIGNVLYALNHFGYTVEPQQIYNDDFQSFTINKSGFSDYTFLINYNETKGCVQIFCLPEPVYEFVLQHQLHSNKLNLCVPIFYTPPTVDGGSDFEVDFDANKIIVFLKNLKRHHKLFYYLYNCGTTEPIKYPSIWKLNKFYKQKKSRQ